MNSFKSAMVDTKIITEGKVVGEDIELVFDKSSDDEVELGTLSDKDGLTYYTYDKAKLIKFFKDSLKALK